VLLDQLTYFASLDPKNAALAAQVDAALAFKRTVEDPTLRADQALHFPVGVPP